MRRRQSIPEQWLVVADADDWHAAKRLARGSGVLLLMPIPPTAMRPLRRLARQRDLTIVLEKPATAVRVHNGRELRTAMLRRTPIVLLSPIYATRSHPDWKPLPRMRAAALVRLGRGNVLALGGMNARRFERVRRLGFQGWAGISAFRT